MSKAKLVILLIVICNVSFIAALLIGKAPLNLAQVFAADEKANLLRTIIFEIRLPRALMAFLAGGFLALSGAVLQAYLRNPLADAAVLGISPFASLGAIIAVYFGLTSLSFWLVPILAIGFAGIGILILVILAQKARTQTGLILCGVVLSSFAGGLMTLALNFAPNPYAIAEIIDWQIGSFANISFKEIFAIGPFLAIGTILIFKSSSFIDAMVLGSDSAKSLGFDPLKYRNKIIISVGILAGAITSMCGIIGFVGLIIPHIIGRIVRLLPSKTLIINFLGGGLLTLVADNFAKSLNFQNEIKVGVITTLIGAPFFLFILFRKDRAID